MVPLSSSAIPASSTILDSEFLEVRAKILEIAAVLDRLQRASGSVENDPRMVRVQQGISALQKKQSNLAEEIQLIFSLPYEENWQEKYQLARRF